METINVGSRVVGTYLGVAFSGTVVEIWGWTHKHLDGDDSVFIELDCPTIVNGVERKMLSWKRINNTCKLRVLS